MLLLLVAQAMSASPPERVDLTIPQPCVTQPASPGEVVVCANRDGKSPYRLDQPVEDGESIPKAEASVGDDVKVAAEAEKGEVGNIPTNRLMVRLKVKF